MMEKLTRLRMMETMTAETRGAPQLEESWPTLTLVPSPTSVDTSWFWVKRIQSPSSVSWSRGEYFP